METKHPLGIGVQAMLTLQEALEQMWATGDRSRADCEYVWNLLQDQFPRATDVIRQLGLADSAAWVCQPWRGGSESAATLIANGQEQIVVESCLRTIHGVL